MGLMKTTENRYLAYQEICEDLIQLDVVVIRSSQEQQLIEFARS